MTEGIRVPLAELETSADDIYVNAKYHGRPFTGVAFDDSGGEYAEYSYLDGAAHGRSFSRFAGGKLADDEVWDHGKLVSGTYWWPPGDAVRLQRAPEGTWYFYQDGTLGIARTADAERRYDPSGVLRQERLYREGGQDFTYYGPDGVWAVKGHLDAGKALTRDCLQFHEDYVRAHCAELLEDPDFLRYFRLWLPEPPKQPRFSRFRFSRDTRSREARPEVCGIVCDLLRAESLAVQYEGVDLAVRYRVTEALPLLEAALAQDCRPPDIRRLDGSSHAYTATVAQRARWAIDTLRKL